MEKKDIYEQDFNDYIDDDADYKVKQKIKSSDAQEANMRTGESPSTYILDFDWRLASIFKNFLEGKDNKVPTFEFMDESFAKAEELDPTGNIVSVGYGLVVRKDCILNISEMIRDDIERHDTIKANEYYAFELNPTNGTQEIDTEKYPRFEAGRIKHIQKYLSDYADHLNKAYQNKSKGNTK